jgi:hypothetical protein
MESPASRLSIVFCALVGTVFLGILAAAETSRAQTSRQAESTRARGKADGAPATVDRGGPNPTAGEAQKKDQPRKEPSQDRRESIRQTVERRRQRRARRRQATVDSRPLGGIVLWPMPPGLIIRQTPQVHDEIEGLLWLLRK